MSLEGILQSQECFNSLGHVLNDKKLKFKSFPEFDGIFYPFYNIDDFDDMLIDILPFGIEEGKHIWDFRFNKAGWNIEKINHKFNFLTVLFAEKPKENTRKAMGIMWEMKEAYKKLCIIPFEYSARFFTWFYCDEKRIKYLPPTQDKKVYQIVEAIGERKEELKSWDKELRKSLDMLERELYRCGGASLFDWIEKTAEIKKGNEETEDNFTQIMLIPLIYSLNPSATPDLDLVEDPQLFDGIKSNPHGRLIHALNTLEKLSTRDILNLGLRGIKKEISENFEKFSYRESLNREQHLAHKVLTGNTYGVTCSLLSLKGDLAFCDISHWGYPVPLFKYMKKIPNCFSLSTTIYRNNSGEYFIKANNDVVAKWFLSELYLTSLGDNILNGEKECPFKGSNYEVECEKCTLEYAKKFCKNSGMLTT